MITAKNGKESAGVRVRACFYVLDPGAECAQWNFVFCLTSYGTGMTTDALAMIDQESVFHKDQGSDERQAIRSLVYFCCCFEPETKSSFQ
jgi:hypothetical protein